MPWCTVSPFGHLLFRSADRTVRGGANNHPPHGSRSQAAAGHEHLRSHLLVGRPYLRAANVFDGFIDYSDVLSMNFELSEQLVYNLRPGDILLNEGQRLELSAEARYFPGRQMSTAFRTLSFDSAPT